MKKHTIFIWTIILTLLTIPGQGKFHSVASSYSVTISKSDAVNNRWITTSQMQSAGDEWYIDNAAKGSDPDGKSWENAWHSFANIDWNSIQPGDTLYISGGNTSKIYSERLVIEKSGESGKPIKIMVGQDSGHNGMVILDGASAETSSGIIISNQSFVVLSGQVGTSNEPKILVENWSGDGIEVTGNSHDLELGYLDITHNGREGRSNYNLNMVVTKHTNIGEIHHSHFHDCRGADEVLLVGQTEGPEITQYGTLKFHHNDIYDWHADGVKISLPGTDFYDNIIRDRGVYLSDHPDGIQAWSSYLRIYNNLFYNFVRTDDNEGNSYIRFNPDALQHSENSRNVLFYNNLFTETNVPQSGSLFRGIELALGDSTLNSAENIVFANNVMKNVPFFGLLLSFNNHTGSESVSNIRIENNVFMDASNKEYEGSAVLLFGKGDGSIIYGSEGSGADVIVDYNAIYKSGPLYSTDVSYNSDIYSHAEFRTVSGCQSHYVETDPKLDGDNKPIFSSPLIDYGVNLSAYFTTDRDGVSRPQGDGWDIGAYEFAPDLDLHGTPGDETIYLDWTVNITIPETTTWYIEYYTQTTTTPYIATNSSNTARSAVLTDNVVNGPTYTVTLSAMLDETLLLSDTVQVTPTRFRFVYLPLVLR